MGLFVGVNAAGLLLDLFSWYIAWAFDLVGLWVSFGLVLWYLDGLCLYSCLLLRIGLVCVIVVAGWL